VLGAVAAVDAPPAALTQPAEFLDIDMDEFAGAVAFVAADHLPGGAIHPGQPGQLVTGQDGVHGGGRQTDQGRDPVRPEFMFPA